MKVKIFFTMLWNVLKAIFSGKDATGLLNTEFAQKYGIPAVEFVNRLKAIVNNPLADIITALTPYPDERILAVARGVLERLAVGLQIVVNSQDLPKEIAPFIQKLALEIANNATDEQKAALYSQFAKELAIALSDGKLTNAEAAALTQTIYATFKQNKK